MPASEPEPGTARPDARGAPSGSGARVVLAAALSAATLPIVVAMVRGLARGWVPVGDNAYFVIRARDVLTEHHPLLGTATSASVAAGVHMNNPGPLLFDLLALPARFGVGGSGIAVGVAAVNAAAAAAVVLFARRRAGPVGAALAAVATAGLAWSMGSELLYEPWQPHSLLLPFLMFVVLVWSVLDGDLVALPWAVVVGSLLVQTHFSYAPLVGVLGLTSVGAFAVHVGRRRRTEGWVDLRRRAGMVVGVTAVAVALCWVQPVVEQLAYGGDGNMARLAEGVAADAPARVGTVDGLRMTATVVALPPGWARPSFDDAFLPAGTVGHVDPTLVELADTLPAVAALTVIAVLLAGMGIGAFRRQDGDRTLAAAAVTSGVALAAGAITTASMPIGILGIAPHQYRWLWPIAVFVSVTLLFGAVRLVPPLRARTNLTAGVLVGLAALLAVLNLPTTESRSGPAADAWAIPVVTELLDGMAALEGRDPISIDLTGVRYAEPYSAPVMAELQRRGITFVVRPDDEVLQRQLGRGRRGDQAATALRIREGDAARRDHDGERRVVFVDGPTPRETVGLFLGPVDHD